MLLAFACRGLEPATCIFSHPTSLYLRRPVQPIHFQKDMILVHPFSAMDFQKRANGKGFVGRIMALLLAFLLLPMIWSHLDRSSSLSRSLPASTSSSTIEEQMEPENRTEHVECLSAVEDLYDGVIVEMKDAMDTKDFIRALKASITHWKKQGKKGVWVKLPIDLAYLVGPVVQEGFRYHHAEPDYLMLVYWMPDTPDTFPANASHRVGIGAFVMNRKREVLVVKEKSGVFKSTGVWKLPTGVVNEGEDIYAAAVREVKEEIGIETEFVEVLAFRQSHQSFFRKSDLFFVCMLRPRSFNIKGQDSELEAAQWMPIDDYLAQPYNKEHQLFRYVAEICKTKLESQYVGLSALPMASASGKETYLYFNSRDFNGTSEKGGKPLRP